MITWLRRKSHLQPKSDVLASVKKISIITFNKLKVQINLTNIDRILRGTNLVTGNRVSILNFSIVLISFFIIESQTALSRLAGDIERNVCCFVWYVSALLGTTLFDITTTFCHFSCQQPSAGDAPAASCALPFTFCLQWAGMWADRSDGLRPVTHVNVHSGTGYPGWPVRQACRDCLGAVWHWITAALAKSENSCMWV